jgi:hypothetical protein
MLLHKKSTFNVIVRLLVACLYGSSVTVKRVPSMSLAYLITNNR